MKSIIVTIIMLLMAMGMISCGKNQDNEWERFYGYTKTDVIGHYEANPDESVYPELPTQGVQVYRNVSIDITQDNNSEDLVRFHIVIPNIIDKTFTGTINSHGNESDMAFHKNKEDVLMTVYKNKQNQVRLNGRERLCRYDANDELIDCIVHGFDVVITSHSSKIK